MRLWWLVCLPASFLTTGLLAEGSSQEEITGREEIVFEPQLGGVFHFDDFLVGYTAMGTLYLPLGDFSDIVDFSILVDPEAGLAGGFFFNERDDFTLNTRESSVTIRGVVQHFDARHLFIDDVASDIYVDTALLSDWFDVTFDHDPLQQTLNIDAERLFPAEEQALRERRRSLLVKNSEQLSTALPLQETPYAALSWPSTRMSIGADHYSGNSPELALRTDLLLLGDFAWMNGELALNLSSLPQAKPAARLRLGRKMAEGGLLGPLNATSFEIGDVNTQFLPLISTGAAGRGITLSSLPLSGGGAIRTTEIRGPAQPGDEAELYRNGALIDFRRVTDSAEFLFSSAPLEYGRNEFVVEIFGLNGRRDSLGFYRFVGATTAKEGEFLYSASAVQEGQPTLTFSDDDSAFPTANPLHATIDTQYGYSDTVTLNMRGAAATVRGVGSTLASVGVTSNVQGALIDVAVATDDDGDLAEIVSVQTRVLDASLFATHENFHTGFESEENTVSTTSLLRRSSISIDKLVQPSERFSPFAVSLRSEFSEYAQNREQIDGALRISSAFSGTSYFATFDGTKRLWLQNSHTLNGQLRASRILGPWRLTGNVDLRLSPEHEVSSLGGSTEFSQPDSYFSLATRYLLPGDGMVVNVSNTWHRERFSLTTAASYDYNTDLYGVYFGVGFEFNVDPDQGLIIQRDRQISRGALSTTVYLDENVNGIREPNEELIDQGTIRVDNQYYALSDNNRIGNLTPHQTTDLRLDPDSLMEPFNMPSSEGLSIRPRPGVTTVVSLPVVRSGDLEGMIRILADQEYKTPDGARVELRKCNQTGLTATTRTYSDGGYLFERLLPGCYLVSLSALQIEALGYQNIDPIVIHIPVSGGVVTVPTVSLGREGSSNLTRPRVIASENIPKIQRPPVARNGSLEGFVQLLDDQELKSPQGARVELRHCNQSDLAATTRTHSDGGYMFERIPPGCYTLSLSARQIDALEYQNIAPFDIQIPSTGVKMKLSTITLKR